MKTFTTASELKSVTESSISEKDATTFKSVATQGEITKVVGNYSILKQIGNSGMSVVSLALDSESNQLRTIKAVEKKSRDKEKNEVVVNHVITEANTLESLDNEYLPKIYSIRETDDMIYLVMEYLEGESLREVVQANGAQNEEDVIKWANQLCEALNYLHLRKPPIIFRGMKPSNILLEPDGNIKLIGFGIASEYKSEGSKDTVSLGTLRYAAPEQFDADTQSDERTDIYNLGATLYHLVTGKEANKSPSVMKPIRYWIPELSVKLEQIIAKATSLDPQLRYQSVKEMLHDIRDIHLDDETSVPSDTGKTTQIESEAGDEPDDVVIMSKRPGHKEAADKKWQKAIISVILAFVLLSGIIISYIALSPNPWRVTGLEGEVIGASEISLKWNESIKATGYEITITANEEAFKKAGKVLPENPMTTTDTSFTITGLVCDEEYRISVIACNEHHDKIVKQKDSAALLDMVIEPPDAVINLTATASEKNDVTVSWDTLNLPKAEIAYSVLASEEAEGEFTEKYEGTKHSFTDKMLVPEREYFYKVRASVKYDGTIFKQESDTVSATTTSRITAPKLKVKDKNDKSISLSWEDMKISGGKVTYSLLRSKKESGKYKEVYKGEKSSFTNNGLKPNTKYFYKVVLICKIGEKEYTSESTIVSGVTKAKPTPTSPTPLPKPTPPTRPSPGPEPTPPTRPSPGPEPVYDW